MTPTDVSSSTNIKEALGGKSSTPFSLPEGILLVMIALCIDIYEILATALVFLFGIGIPLVALGSIFDVGWTIGSTLLFKMKGGKWALNITGSIIEWIPGLDILPIRTISTILAIFLSNQSVEKDTD